MQPFITNQETLNSLIGNGKKFVVPRFQRDYSWTEEHWDDLWTDMTAIDFTNKEDSHYMGYMVLQQQSDTEFVVVDGQQRITTLSILIIAALYRIDELIANGIDIQDNEKRKEVLSNYIGFVNPITLSRDSKLTLNRNNNTYYRSYLCQLVKNPPLANIKLTEKYLINARVFFEERLKEHFADDGQKIIEFINNIGYRLYFTTIIVSDDINAYKIFETLNARGVQLSTPDLLKNYLFSLIAKENSHDSILDDLDDIWENITTQLRSNSFSDFIRTDWNSKNPITSKNELFKKISSDIKIAESSYKYINTLHENVHIYSALNDYNDELWQNMGNNKQEIKLGLYTLDIFNVRQPIGILYSAYINFELEEFVKVLRYIEVMTIRYNVICGLHARDQEGLYNKIARAISNKEYSNASNVKKMLSQIYPDDASFISAFEKKEFKVQRSNQAVRFLLLRLENYLNSNSTGIFDNDLTLEHILPEKPNQGWIDSFGEYTNYFVQKLGNLALLSAKDNKNIGQSLFENKKEILVKSGLQTNLMLQDYTAWDKDAINKRQKELAKYAKTLWRINF